MKKTRCLLISCCLVALPVWGQIQQGKKDAILLTEICVDRICFGDSLSKIFNHFGKPDTVIRSIPDTVEFAEPLHKSYRYGGFIFYEILHPNLSEGLFYGCIVREKGVVVSIKGIDLIIGETMAESVLDDFAQSITDVVKPRFNDKELYITMCTTLPGNLKSIEGDFIREIVFYFTDNILKHIETRFDLN
jgi:hypothetical protein